MANETIATPIAEQGDALEHPAAGPQNHSSASEDGTRDTDRSGFKDDSKAAIQETVKRDKSPPEVKFTAEPLIIDDTQVEESSVSSSDGEHPGRSSPPAERHLGRGRSVDRLENLEKKRTISFSPNVLYRNYQESSRERSPQNFESLWRIGSRDGDGSNQSARSQRVDRLNSIRHSNFSGVSTVSLGESANTRAFTRSRGDSQGVGSDDHYLRLGYTYGEGPVALDPLDSAKETTDDLESVFFSEFTDHHPNGYVPSTTLPSSGEGRPYGADVPITSRPASGIWRAPLGSYKPTTMPQTSTFHISNYPSWSVRGSFSEPASHRPAVAHKRSRINPKWLRRPNTAKGECSLLLCMYRNNRRRFLKVELCVPNLDSEFVGDDKDGPTVSDTWLFNEIRDAYFHGLQSPRRRYLSFLRLKKLKRIARLHYTVDTRRPRRIADDSPLDQHQLMSAFENPSGIRPGTEWVAWVFAMKADPYNKEGLEFVEGWNGRKIAIIGASVLIGTTLMAGLWAGLGGDLQTVFTVASFLLALSTASIGLLAILSQIDD
ncbi:MAG: hypothetical protein M1833_000421 [Piccolia ochrophora]|nr:MAG: hypothetical protein M1833_000421 [Piccolia ochrophora]